jgi:hypothetical protein
MENKYLKPNQYALSKTSNCQSEPKSSHETQIKIYFGQA